MPKGLPRSLSAARRLKSPGLDLVSFSLGTPAAPSATAVHAAITLTASAQTGIATGITNPDSPRNITIKGNASGNAGNVVIHGTNREGDAISETIALSGASEIVGNKAFATVTAIDAPAETHAGTDTVSIGWGAKLGLPVKLGRDTLLNAYLGGAREATRPTVVTSASAIEGNTVALSTTLDGSEVVVDLYV